MVFLVLALQRANREAALKDQANRELQEMADAGFRLLANEDRIERGQRTELELPPAWPRHHDAYGQWRANYTDALTEELRKVRARLQALDEQRQRQGGELSDPVDRHLERALRRLRGQLAAFLGDGGPAAQAAARLRWSSEHLVDETGGDAYDETWQLAQEGIKASAEYRGLRLQRLAGLVPLGRNPSTRLWEFLDLRTHAEDYPLPSRDAATGELQTDAGTGVVFVLVPGGQAAIGARRDAPGLERNDDDARDDELNDATVSLEPFLVAKDELNVAQFARLTGAIAPNRDPRLPMTDVNWLTATRALGRWGMSLPTEAQWEYACRARSTTPWCSGSDAAAAARFGWFDGGLALCGQLRANGFGLRDVHGNVAEWCRDEKLPYPDYPARDGDGLRARTTTDPTAWRVVRGGSVRDGARGCRATVRASHAPEGGDGVIGVRPTRAINP